MYVFVCWKKTIKTKKKINKYGFTLLTAKFWIIKVNYLSKTYVKEEIITNEDEQYNTCDFHVADHCL